ncbi:MAG TPA: hypothetical protein VLU25_11215 [Acidobacteriota bacterium]|nr:hypothetical protein [Acidobacteriota bacterium]
MSELVKSQQPLPTRSDQATVQETGDLNIRDAIRLCRKDEKFRTVFFATPETLDEAFELSESQIAGIRSAGESSPDPEQALVMLEHQYPAPRARANGN